MTGVRVSSFFDQSDEDMKACSDHPLCALCEVLAGYKLGGRLSSATLQVSAIRLARQYPEYTNPRRLFSDGSAFKRVRKGSEGPKNTGQSTCFRVLQRL